MKLKKFGGQYLFLFLTKNQVDRSSCLRSIALSVTWVELLKSNFLNSIWMTVTQKLMKLEKLGKGRSVS